MPRGGETVPFSMTWEDEEFESFGKQILEAKAVPRVPPKQADANQHMILNMGPQHPATHGVLRLIVELDGERVVAVYPDLGYLHSGFEKQGESIRYKDFTPYTDRMDYLSSMSNNLGYALAVEKLMGVEIPPRAQAIRVIMAELQRLASHLFWLGTHAMDVAGTGHGAADVCAPGTRADPRHLRAGQRRTNHDFLHPTRRNLEGRPAQLSRSGARCAGFLPAPDR